MDREPAQSDGCEVCCGPHVLGTLIVESVGPRRERYRFIPGPDFARYRPLFERATALARRVTQSIDDGQGLDYQADSQWVEAIGQISALGLTAGKEQAPIREFALFEDWSAEVEFGARPNDRLEPGQI